MPDPGRVLIAVGLERTDRPDVLDTLRCVESVKAVFAGRGLPVEPLYVRSEDFPGLDRVRETILSGSPLKIFNLFEGFSGDSGKEVTFASMLEKLRVPFTGNPSVALEMCLDKAKAKQRLARRGILVPRGVFLQRLEGAPWKGLNFPLFVKPCFEDGSVGVEKDSLIQDAEGIEALLRMKLAGFPRGILLEEFIPGKEFSVGFLGAPPYEVLGVSMIDYSLYSGSLPFLHYGSKWDPQCTEFHEILPVLEEGIAPSLRERLVDTARKAGEALGCRGYFRVDLREREGRLYVLDVNPNPDLNEDSGFARQGRKRGYSYPEVVERILFYAN
ncbi:MAG TPA: ATP-grasp domain-containing protein [Synergistales bacterium]|nr:ATP-grasp domain-containing protein [Synergistales bacterium]